MQIWRHVLVMTAALGETSPLMPLKSELGVVLSHSSVCTSAHTNTVSTLLAAELAARRAHRQAV